MDRRSQEITYIGKNLAAICNIPFGEYDESGKLIECFWRNTQIPDLFRHYIKELIRDLDECRIKKINIGELPIAMWIYYSVDGRYFAWGPVQYKDFSQDEKEIYENCIGCKLQNYQLFQTNYGKVLSVISCFIYAIDKRMFSFSDIEQYEENVLLEVEINRQNTNYMIHQEDILAKNHTYNDEYFPLELLRDGDEDGVRQYIYRSNIHYPQTMTNPKKNEEYMAVAAVSIMARAAIDAGATSVESFRLSDVFLERISLCKDVKEIKQERENALIAFTRLVKTSKRNDKINPHVMDCKNAIAAHIFQKISLDDIAKELGIRATYLARIFIKEEGITVGQYIRREKIKLAMNMLKYSDRSIAEISDYLGFSSQSYFGKNFKEESGMTPELYRRKNRTSEF